MENWAWERAVLDRFARHWQTGEPLPEPLFERLKSVRTFRAASAQMRQLGFAALDMALHTGYAPAPQESFLDFARRIMQPYAPAPLTEDYAMVASFGHLFAHSVGYAAGYYAYKWAEVLDADAFGRFAREGLFNRDLGRRWRDEVLAVGDSRDPLEVFVGFMGREPDPEALMRRQGLVP